jgi:hypothetical protein
MTNRDPAVVNVNNTIKGINNRLNASPVIGKNSIINGDFRVAQRGTTLTVADGAYGLDRWVALGSGTGGEGSSGQNVNMIQVSSIGNDVVNTMLLSGSTAGLKFGCVQIIESRNLAGLKTGTVTVSFRAAVNNGAADVRCAVLGWSGTADAVTRDVVSTSGTPWLSSPPTLAANWSYLNTPVDLNVTNTVATYSVNANVTGLPNNLAVFIWVNGTSHASNGTLLLNDVQLESGAIATPFERKTFQEQLANCQRYYWRISKGGGTAKYVQGLGGAAGTNTCSFIVNNPVAMRSAATSIEYFGIQPTDIMNYFGGEGFFSLVQGSSTALTTFIYNNTSGGLVEGRPHAIAITSVVGFFGVSAEL